MGGVGVVGVAALVLLVAGTMLFLRHAVYLEPDRYIARLVGIALAAKIAGAGAYYFMIAQLYGGGDVTGYVRVGRRLAAEIRSGRLPEQAWETGTLFMQFLAGLHFATFGPSELLAYLVFSGLSFLGMYLCVQAFRLGVPDGSHRRYATVLLLLPTLIFWTSTVGKEAWLVFTLGVGIYGSARVMRRRPLGYLIVMLGVAGMSMIRPHMGALFAISFAIAFLLRVQGAEGKRRTLLAWMVGLVIVTVGTGYALVNFSEEMGRSELDYMTPAERIAADTEEIFERTDRLTRRGAGQFDSRPVQGPSDLLHAAITVPFRPLPWEAHNRQAQLAGIESLLVVILLALSLQRLASIPRQMLRSPLIALSLAYVIGFIVAFSHVGNFGILTRQRAQLMPLLLVLVALPKATEASRRQRRRTRPPVLTVIDPDSTGDTTPSSNLQSRQDAGSAAPTGPLAQETPSPKRADGSRPHDPTS